jgi:phage baseplate assembly protein W
MSQIAYPISFTNGAINLVEDEATRVKQAILHLLNTRIAERLWFPEYGYSPEVFRPVRETATQVEILKMLLKDYMVDYDFTLRDILARVDSNGQLRFTVLYSTSEENDSQVST